MDLSQTRRAAKLYISSQVYEGASGRMGPSEARIWYDARSCLMVGTKHFHLHPARPRILQPRPGASATLSSCLPMVMQVPGGQQQQQTTTTTTTNKNNNSNQFSAFAARSPSEF